MSGDQLGLGDVQDNKSFVQAAAANSTGSSALKTTLSQETSPRSGLSTYDLSSVMQGAALYRPPGLVYDTFNQELSGELQNLGIESKFTNRDEKLNPYDVFIKPPDPKTASQDNPAGGSGAIPAPAPTTDAAKTGTGEAPPPLTGGSKAAFCIGDSISDGCKAGLEKNDKGWVFSVDSKQSRPPSVGIEHVRDRKGDFGSVVVVNLGTNPDGKTPDKWIGEMMGYLKDVPRVCWVTCIEWTDYCKRVNLEIHALDARETKVVVVDWASVVAGDRSLVSGDGVHPNGLGYIKLVGMIFDMIGPAPS